MCRALQDLLWSIRTVLTVEPCIAIDIRPGCVFPWKNAYEYYLVQAGSSKIALKHFAN
jgi:hypothetical protein